MQRVQFRYIHGGNPLVTCRAMKRQVINGVVEILEPEVEVKFHGGFAAVADTDPDFEVKVAALRKNVNVVEVGAANEPEKVAAAIASQPALPRKTVVQGFVSVGGAAPELPSEDGSALIPRGIEVKKGKK